MVIRYVSEDAYEDEEGEFCYYPDTRDNIMILCEIILGEYPESDDRYILADKIKNEYINL